MSQHDANQPTLTVGQEVVLCRSGTWETHYTFGWTVTKVTPSGQFTIAHHDACGVCTRQIRFNKDGREMGSEGYRTMWIDTDVAGLRNRVATKEARGNAVQLLRGVTAGEVGRGASKEYLLATVAKMRAALDAVDAAIAALPN